MLIELGGCACGEQGPCGRPARPQAADWPRLAAARGSLEHNRALKAAPGAPAGRGLSRLVCHTQAATTSSRASGPTAWTSGHGANCRSILGGSPVALKAALAPRSRATQADPRVPAPPCAVQAAVVPPGGDQARPRLDGGLRRLDRLAERPLVARHREGVGRHPCRHVAKEARSRAAAVPQPHVQGTCIPASCVPCVPELAQGRLAPGGAALGVRFTRTSLGRAVPTAHRTVWCTPGEHQPARDMDQHALAVPVAQHAQSAPP
eukprot:scaffold7542_cov57-Phaeocystis_antarctica.AAC.1